LGNNARNKKTASSNQPMSAFTHIFLSPRFYWTGAAFLALSIACYFFPDLLSVIQILFLGFLLLTIVDIVVLFSNKRGVMANRNLSQRFSNGDNNKVQIALQNNFSFLISGKILDEIPPQFQLHDWQKTFQLKGKEKTTIPYFLRPVERGEYDFGKLNVFVSSPIGLVIRRFAFEAATKMVVYPSFMQMKKYQLLATSNQLNEAGAHRMRKIGASTEFEQIKEYVRGDDFKRINWQATARKDSLMVNSYVDERSQSIICIIDKGRNMRSPFKGMTLLDYAINATLVLTNVALLKQDKAGVVTFSEKLGNTLTADKKVTQMEQILQLLYNQKTQYLESDFEALYTHVRTRIKQRSLLVLFTNFEGIHNLYRQLPYLRQIAQYHLLMVVFFENTEINSLLEQPTKDMEGIYIKTIADKFVHEKRLIAKELQKHGILSVITSPENLTVSAVNKYLELKARQAL
jgi:uncharacterized protein (DUF58 family)